MPNQITAAGLETATQTEIISELTTDLQAIYGADIDVDSDTPDGQLINIIAQIELDVLDLLTQIYNGIDPDLAIGNVLDQRVALNGIQRQAGTFTVTPITITVDTDDGVTLTGLDESDTPYTVADEQGNQWYLQETQNIVAAGSASYDFRAALPGETFTTPNTITVPVTVVLGVSAINNPSTYTTLGINEETDAVLRVRRQQSVSLSSQGYFNSLLAALLNINGVVSADVIENVTDATDADDIPSHSIWVIVEGTADDVDIANAIYTKRNAGCGMKHGAESYTITQLDGSPFTVYWDEVEEEDVFIEFDATSLNGIDAPNTAAILAGLPESFVPGVNEEINVNQLATLVQAIDSNTLVTNAGLSLSGGGPFTNTLSPSEKNKKLLVSSANIDITVV